MSPVEKSGMRGDKLATVVLPGLSVSGAIESVGVEALPGPSYLPGKEDAKVRPEGKEEGRGGVLRAREG